jgi:hypothetical protein
MQGMLTAVGQTTEAIRDNKQKEKKGIDRQTTKGWSAQHSLDDSTLSAHWPGSAMRNVNTRSSDTNIISSRPPTPRPYGGGGTCC